MARPGKGPRRTWRFKLNEGTILEVSAPNGPAEEQVRRRGRVSLVLGTLVTALMVSAVALASVSTDKYYYDFGEAVQISGDSMAADEDVSVDVAFPDGSLAQNNVVQADGDGNFSDSFYLAEGMPSGIYTVTATGHSSGSVYTTEFDPPAATTVNLNDPGDITYGDPVTFTGTISSTAGVPNAGTIAILESKQRKSTPCTGPDFNGVTTIATDTNPFDAGGTSGNFSSGSLNPVLATFPVTTFASGSYAVRGMSGPPDNDPAVYAPAIGSYAFRADYSGGGGNFANNQSGCVEVDVVKANTAANSKPADGAGSLITQVGLGGSFFVEWDVSSTNGITGNSAAGDVALTQSAVGLGCPAGDANKKSFTAAQTTGSGFSYFADFDTNSGSRFSCTPTATGNYTVFVTFADNPATDGNYNGDASDSDPVEVIQTVQVCKAAPAIAAEKLKALGVKSGSALYKNTLSRIAGEMADLTRAQFPDYAPNGMDLVTLDLLRPCDSGYVASVEARTVYYKNNPQLKK